MQLKTYDKKEKTKNNKTTILVVVVFLFVVAIVLGKSFAYYQKEEDKQITIGEVGEYCTIGKTWEFDYEVDENGNGYGQEFKVPCSGNYKIELWGASGGNANNGGSGHIGKGGYTEGIVRLTVNKKIYVYVGQKGKDGIEYQNNTVIPTSFNGGGASADHQYISIGGGGGATDIRLENGLWSNFDSLKSRIMVAAGGAGANFWINTGYRTGGAGGGLTGGNGTIAGCLNSSAIQAQAQGGSQTSGGINNVGNLSGSFGKGGSSGSGGGGGYYGGSEGRDQAMCPAAGGGGSSFISGHNGCDAIEETSTEDNITHKGNSEHYSGYIFSDTTMIDGYGYNWTDEKGEYVGQPQPDGTVAAGHLGNGYARVTYLGYTDPELNGADPVIKDGLIPVKIENDGTVKKVNPTVEWYDYKNKKWANAVILVDKTKSYDYGDIIPESNIESYFVWIPKYSYKLWDLGNYNTLISGVPTTNKEQEIQIKFGLDNTSDANTGECTTPMTSGTSGNCSIGKWMTHPAFISMNTTGLWVGKFETTGTTSKITIKPNLTSLKDLDVKTIFETSYNYQRNLDSHMAKNTEWGAVAYLSRSKYGINKEVGINNNSNYLTGYSSTDSANQNIFPGTYGTTSDLTQSYNTEIGYKASTTGNITGIYDMNGGAHEYLAAYISGKLGSSNFTTSTINLYDSKYFDIYNNSSSEATYQYRILGDATGEMGPFYKDASGINLPINSWGSDYSLFIHNDRPWFQRGSFNSYGIIGSQFEFTAHFGGSASNTSFRVVLAP